MGHGTEHHLEHAEHVQHHAHDPFDRRVAMSMAIIAAALAGVTLLSHRGHTETLRLQAEANSIQNDAALKQSQANIYHVRASDQWAFYQAKNIRRHEYAAYLKLSSFLAKEPGSEKQFEAARKSWQSVVDRYEGRVNDPKGDEDNLSNIMKNARGLEVQAAKFQVEGDTRLNEAKGETHKSHLVHGAVNWLDVGHLAIEMALVLCSVAVLTKQRSFWIAGILVAMFGMGVASVGMVRWYMMEHDDVPHQTEHKTQHEKPHGEH